MKLGILFPFHRMIVQWTRNLHYTDEGIMKVLPEDIIFFCHNFAIAEDKYDIQKFLFEARNLVKGTQRT